MPDITRVNGYNDKRFSGRVLKQHGAFLVDGEPYEVEIVSPTEAVARGADRAKFPALIDDFRFFAEHITLFRDSSGAVVGRFEPVATFELSLDLIQPSQFYVDSDKKRAVASFIASAEDVVIPVIAFGERFISLDGHTRMSVAVDRGLDHVRAFFAKSDGYIKDFAAEAVRRGVMTPRDLIELSHDEYAVKWDAYCGAYFAQIRE